MTERTLESMRPRVSELLKRPAIPGVVIAVARDGRPVEHLAAGSDAHGQPLAPDSLFPVASITKLVTALSVLRLADRGVLHYEDRLDAYLPESAAARAGVTLAMLFTHTGGLQGMEEELGALDSRTTPGRRVRGCAARRAGDQPGDAPVVQRRRLCPAGDGRRAIDGPNPFLKLVASSCSIHWVWKGISPRSRRGHRRGSATSPARTPAPRLEWHNSAFFRSLCLPASGLVTTAAGALALVRAFAGVPDDFLRPETRAAATRDQSGEVAGGLGAVDEPPEFASHPWGLGPELYDRAQPIFAPAEASPESFGHGGSSGCVTWADPAAGVAWSILGTRHIANWWGDPVLGEIGAEILTLG